MPMKKYLLIVTALVIAAGVYMRQNRAEDAGPVVQLVTAPVARGNVVQTIRATGRLEAVTTVQVGSQISGTIKQLLADFNSPVRRGQVIAELEPSLLQTQVDQAAATLVRLQAEVERARVQSLDAQAKLRRSRELAQKNLISTSDLETAEASARAALAAFEAAEAQVVQARAALNQTQVNRGHAVITAPIDGVVISRNVDVGQTVAASMQAPTLFEIAHDLAQMQVTASIDESDIGWVREGQRVTFQVDAYQNDTFDGTVRQVRLNPNIESNVVSYITVIDVPNDDLRLRPGMTANVVIEVARADDVLTIPGSALRFEPTPDAFASLGQPVPDSAARRAVEATAGARGGDAGSLVQKAANAAAAPDGHPGRVWALQDGRLEMVQVRTGIDDGASVAVVAGELHEGLTVVTGMVEETGPARAGSPLLPRLLQRRGEAAAGSR
jgi:HlyD family secretion protein